MDCLRAYVCFCSLALSMTPAWKALRKETEKCQSLTEDPEVLTAVTTPTHENALEFDKLFMIDPQMSPGEIRKAQCALEKIYLRKHGEPNLENPARVINNLESAPPPQRLKRE